MKKLLAVLLLFACSGPAENVNDKVFMPVPPQRAIGTWENLEGVSFYLNSTSYGKDWLIYGWVMPDCQEGGFAEATGKQLMLGGINPQTACFSRISPNYTATFAINERDELQVQLSVQDEPLLLQRK